MKLMIGFPGLLATLSLLAGLQTLLIAQTPNFQMLDRSVVDVNVTCPFQPDGNGLDECSQRASGIVISERDGIVRVLTARHEVHAINKDPNAAIRLTFAFDQLKSVPAKLLKISNEQLDLAVLEAELPKGATGFGSLPLTWNPQSSIKQGGQLWAVDGTWQPQSGTVVSVVKDQDGQRVRYISEASKGYSGGPIFDSAGDLVAVHLRSRTDLATNLRDGVTFEAVMAWLSSIGYSEDSINRLVISTVATAGNYSKAPDTPKLRPVSNGDRGTLLFRAGRYAEALPILSEAARAGDGHAATIIVGMYLAGQGVPISFAEANRWAQLGAAAGDNSSMNVLGADYVAGVGFSTNYVLGASWYQKSAAQGDMNGMFGFGLMFANGQINADGKSARLPPRHSQDTDTQAVYWFRRGSQAGDLRARAQLGIMYANGRGGLSKNDTLAFQLYRSAADQGDRSGMQLVGDMYLAGRVGGRRDFDQAILWYKKSAALNDAIAKERLQSIAAANPGFRF